MAKKVLFIGGTGVISSGCAPQILNQGHELYLFNRGQSKAIRQVPDGAVVIQGNINNSEDINKALQEHTFDVVVDWIAFHPDQVARDYKLFKDRVGQYIFISSASAYQKPVPSLPITEETPLLNPYWEYSRNKIACERFLMEVYQRDAFPVTIVRPSHTYDKTMLPFRGGYTIIDRMRKGKKIIIHGDGTSLWVLTHHTDFGKAFAGLVGVPQAVGQVYQITSDQVLTWNRIFELAAEAAGAELNAVHLTSRLIAKYDQDWGASLLGDKAHSVIFDNSKIKALVPGFSADISFEQGIREIVSWYDADPARQIVDQHYEQIIDRIIRENNYE